MLKSTLILLAFAPPMQGFLSPLEFRTKSVTHPSVTELLTRNPLNSALAMHNAGEEGAWSLSKNDAAWSMVKFEMLLSEEDFSQASIKDIINTASYTLLPDLRDHLADLRIEQIKSLHSALEKKESVDYAASYYASYIATRFLDDVTAPLAASLLLQPRLIPSLQAKSDQGMELPNIAELVLPNHIVDSLWFESLKTSEIPLSLEENIQSVVASTKRQKPVSLASDLLKSAKQINERLKQAYLAEHGALDEGFNKLQWTLTQSLVLHKLADKQEGFADVWLELYELFKSYDMKNEEAHSFHDYLMSWIGVSYFGEEQVFQRMHEELNGYRRHYDFYANAFTKVLKWHRALDDSQG